MAPKLRVEVRTVHSSCGDIEIHKLWDVQEFNSYFITCSRLGSSACGYNNDNVHDSQTCELLQCEKPGN
jgi:hypothetical protein